MTSTLMNAVKVALVLWIISLVSWALAVASTTPEPEEILSMARRGVPAQSQSGHGMSFDLRSCSHCPSFLILDRGFGSGIESPLVLALTTWTLPAAWVARGGRPWSEVVAVSPYSLSAALLVQWLVLALIVLGALRGIKERRVRAL
jgi:hypothetical protein